MHSKKRGRLHSRILRSPWGKKHGHWNNLGAKQDVKSTDKAGGESHLEVQFLRWRHRNKYQMFRQDGQLTSGYDFKDPGSPSLL